ncbi:MAG: primosomal protein N' [Oligoflexia bacterium]|nr:primosomal protein N' [Oligoflexia bacterium]
MSSSDLVQVAVDAPIGHLFTYKVPDHLKTELTPGTKVIVPFGRRQLTGVALNRAQDVDSKTLEKLKPISEIYSEPRLGQIHQQWLTWLAHYYLHPIGQVFGLAFAPGPEKRKRASHKISPTAVVSRSQNQKHTPNEDQAHAISEILKAAHKKAFETFLLYGITGSGKTEVYLQVIEGVLAQDKTALVLVPEISLTPQLIERFVTRFGDEVAVIHSHLTPREKADQWWSAVKGEKRILVGARSALFCPLDNLGVIIIDEEHDSSFKQEEGLKYHARDSSIMKARLSQCPVVLGSATPSLESWANMEAGKFKLLELKGRVENRELPDTQIVDMRLVRENRDDRFPSWLSPQLYQELAVCLERGEQSALFLNRRGYAQCLICPDCGYSETCLNCSVTLTAHDRGQKLLCHYCGFEKPLPKKCIKCLTGEYRPLGNGTERVAEDIEQLFSQRGVTVRVARADRDEINTREKLESLLNRIHQKEIDIIVGTQMIAKGHDFPELTLVGVVLADVGLHIPDFRSSERIFQLLTQVAGRAGRHGKPGKVLIQTYVPEHFAIQHALRHDFRGFAQEELKCRKELLYPPFGRLAALRIQGPELAEVESTAMAIMKRLKNFSTIKPEFGSVELLGPTEAVLSRLKNKFRFQILAKGPSTVILNNLMQFGLQLGEEVPSKIDLSIDMDPVNLL